MCIMHKKLLKNDGYFMQFFVRSMNFFLPPQYIVLEPAKMRYFQLKSTIYCGRVKLANWLEMLYHVRSTASHSIAHTYTDSAVLPRRTACAQRIVCRCVPCQVNNAQLKTLTRTARTVPLTASGSFKPAQHSAHTTASTIASAFQNRRCRTRAKLNGRYWCTLKSKHRTARIQLHHRVTVVLPAPAV